MGVVTQVKPPSHCHARCSLITKSAGAKWGNQQVDSRPWVYPIAFRDSRILTCVPSALHRLRRCRVVVRTPIAGNSPRTVSRAGVQCVVWSISWRAWSMSSTSVAKWRGELRPKVACITPDPHESAYEPGRTKHHGRLQIRMQEHEALDCACPLTSDPRRK
jgi:hypothetical protein